jgi:hypothetical protein
MVKKLLFSVVIFVCLSISSYAYDNDEITLFDSSGNAVAYIDTADRDFTVYLWSGRPVAYIVSNHIYGFNGRHLGWFQNGIIRDNNGYAVGATRESLSRSTRSEPSKRSKRSKPSQRSRQSAPSQPSFRNSWSGTDLEAFLSVGIN